MSTKELIISTTIIDGLKKIEQAIEKAQKSGLTAEELLDFDVNIFDWQTAVNDHVNTLLEKTSEIPERVEVEEEEADDSTREEDIENGLEPLPADDLTDLPHVGAATARRLEDDGKYTFSQVSKMSIDKLSDYPGVTDKEAANIIEAAEKLANKEL